MKYSVIIVGGGISGLSCGLILGSAKDQGPWAEGRRILILDNRHSDALAARYYNAAGLKQGTAGRDELEEIRMQMNRYDSVEQKIATVTHVSGEKGNFTVVTEAGESFSADTIVLATGFHFFKIEGLELEVVNNEKSYKENKVQIKNNHFKVRDGLFVAGLLAGVSSQFSIAAGSGAQVACDIMTEWAGTNTVVHDKV